MTAAEQKMLDFVRELIAVGRIDPTVRDLASAMDVSVSSAHATLTRLVRDGHLDRVPGKPRGLRLPGVPDLRAVPNDVLTAELARRGVTLAALDPRMPIARGAEKTCAADSCGAPVRPGQLMCLTHWRALPQELQRRIFSSHRARDRRGYQDAVAEARDLADGFAWGKRA